MYVYLNTHYFQQAFSSPWSLPLCTSDLAFADIVHIHKFHLLTYLLTYIKMNYTVYYVC